MVVLGKKNALPWLTVMKISPTGRSPMEEWQISEGRKHLAARRTHNDTQNQAEETERERDSSVVAPEIDLAGAGLQITLDTVFETTPIAFCSFSCSSESWRSSDYAPLPRRRNTDDIFGIDEDDEGDEGDDSSVYHRGDIDATTKSSNERSYFYLRRDIPRGMARQRQWERARKLESLMPAESLQRVDQVISGEAHVRDFVQRRYESHWNSVTFIPGVTTSRLCDIGRMDRLQGIAACKQLLRVPVIQEEVTTALYEELADRTADNLNPIVKHCHINAETVTQDNILGQESIGDTIVTRYDESRRCSDATTLIGSGKTGSSRRSSATPSNLSASSSASKAKSKERKKRNGGGGGKNQAKHLCAYCFDTPNGLCSSVSPYQETATSKKGFPMMLPKIQEAKKTPAAAVDGFWSAPELPARPIHEPYDENRGSRFLISKDDHGKHGKYAKSLGKFVFKGLGKAYRHICRKVVGLKADSESSALTISV